MRGDRRQVVCLLSLLATTFTPGSCDCDSISLPEETLPPPLPQHHNSCQGPFPVLLKVSLGEKFAGLEQVVRTEPSSLVVARCSGHCTAGYHSVCRGTTTSIRNVTVGVVYTEAGGGGCETTLITVEDDLSCGCDCSQGSHVTCPGLATFQNESCTCRCDSSLLATDCPPGRMFSSQDCSCVCSSVTPSCWWPAVWTDQHCGCTLVLTREMIVYLSLTVLILALVTQFYCICKYLTKIKNLENQLENHGQQRLSLRQLQNLVKIQPHGRKSSSKLSHIAYSGIVNNNMK